LDQGNQGKKKKGNFKGSQNGKSLLGSLVDSTPDTRCEVQQFRIVPGAAGGIKGDFQKSEDRKTILSMMHVGGEEGKDIENAMKKGHMGAEAVSDRQKKATLNKSSDRRPAN